ncbi:MAG TPA: radical SAM family heme chaperone HemW [Actinomycetota bacterium]|nr:radical SAM family heme chaperone HemW [Actinomycetota bacterium]
MKAGLYVHVPFCLTRCGYCDFNAHAGLLHLADRYVEALVREAELAAPSWAGVRFASIFVGGGTPTTLGPAALGAVLAALQSRFEVAPDAEVTVEANPDTVDPRSLAALRDAGVNRLSLGVQSFDPAVLRALDRAHPPASARRAYRDARAAGFDDVNLDLIYGAHGETPASWRRTLDEAVAMGPEHLSCYALTVESGTPLGRAVLAGDVPPPDPDLQAAMFEHACRTLAAAGYAHYEISNWARPRRECLHNLGYWEGRPYLGLGAGAHSARDGRRWWNVRPPGRYIEEALAGRLPIGGREEPEEEARRLERLFLGLRHAGGVPAAWVEPAAAADVVARGLARRSGDRLALTERGMLLANDVVLALSG